ncbi:thioredoxin-like fold domain-containing protein MRL7L, chloroplastic [Magnolia sinica]|uniref:thioredoxin-like fold domain-containing protein MRL7L, chloroplastic n=1 Tax=Magnolia sinica TaxID=86752 RepID=UPI00265B2272|nr:thioredoxin-like fold domain-containing protein MRL7L, chloroplastic [Magnolia sinica]
MALQYPLRCRCSISVLKEESKLQSSFAMAGSVPLFKNLTSSKILSITSGFSHTMPEYPKLRKRSTKPKASKVLEEVSYGDGKEEDERTRKSDVGDDSDESHDSNANVKGKSNTNDDDDGPLLMTNEERRELRRKIREVIDMNPDVEEEEDPIERRKKMEKLLSDYPLVVDEEDPNWPEDADGRGFNLSQFFNKITIKNVRKDDDDDYDSDKELVWQDDNYIKPIKDISTGEWEETVFKDISPLIILVHNRYKRPRENEKLRNELVKAVQIFWDSRLPSPRCVAIDAVVELDLVSALKVTIFPEVIFTKAGKILYREKVVRTADELSKIMAFFYYGATRPPCLNGYAGDNQEAIPSIP